MSVLSAKHTIYRGYAASRAVRRWIWMCLLIYFLIYFSERGSFLGDDSRYRDATFIFLYGFGEWECEKSCECRDIRGFS